MSRRISHQSLEDLSVPQRQASLHGYDKIVHQRRGGELSRVELSRTANNTSGEARRLLRVPDPLPQSMLSCMFSYEVSGGVGGRAVDAIAHCLRNLGARRVEGIVYVKPDNRSLVGGSHLCGSHCWTRIILRCGSVEVKI